ncbi:MAG: hypothetical protein R2777_02040 [Chitinophagales bacterium]
MPQFEQEKGVISNTVKEEALTALVSLGLIKLLLCKNNKSSAKRLSRSRYCRTNH